jgi:hypothetical protein
VRLGADIAAGTVIAQAASASGASREASMTGSAGGPEPGRMVIVIPAGKAG